MKNLTINITSKCTAECKHCCFSCAPNRTDELKEEEIWNAVNYGINNDEINAILVGSSSLNEKEFANIINLSS